MLRASIWAAAGLWAVFATTTRGQTLFEDGFETGLGAWAVAPGCTEMEWFGGRNMAPPGGNYSARADSSSDRIWHDLGAEASLNVRATWWIYDDTLARASGEVRARSPEGVTEQVYAAGKHDTVTMPGETYDGSKYQGCVQYPSATMGWFNLNDPGSPSRSPGWHKFTVVATGDGRVRFYVDDVLSRTIQGAAVRTVDAVFLGLGAEGSTGDAWFDGVSVEDVQNVLILDATPDSLYVRPGEPVVIHMDVRNLAQMVNGCQALIGYSSSYFVEPWSVVPGGGPWTELIYESWTTPGDLDVAVGVTLDGPPGTDEDGTVATITLTAGDLEGVTRIVFRDDPDPDYATMLSDLSARAIYPTRVNTLPIVIDATPPSLEIAHALQGGQELLISLGSTVPAVQGQVRLQITAEDSLAGLGTEPTVEVTDSDGVPMAVTFVGQDPPGTYNYDLLVTPLTANGLATITASVADRSGNPSTTDVDQFRVNKTRISGRVEMQDFVGTGTNPPHTRAVTFIATGTTTKTWVLTLQNASGPIFEYVLDDVPPEVTSLSAKTAWSLRRRLPVTFDPHGQATADFVGAARLPGGDLNGTNMVNILDYSILKIHWYGSYPAAAAADIDGDGQVRMEDYTILKSNWFRFGDPP